MKITKKNILKSIISLLVLISILFLNLFSLIVSAAGGDVGDLDYSSVYIRNVNSGKYITVPNGTVSNGKEVKIYEASENVSQKWGIENLNNGYYCIRSEINDNYILSVENDTNGEKIVLKYLSDDSPVPENAQFWMFSMSDFGCAYLISYLSVLNKTFRAMDCKNNGSTDGTNLVQYDLNGNIDECASQLWVFEYVLRSFELNNWDLVDSGGHCDWDCSTQYSAMVRKAANAWNDYIGDEVFRPDAWNIIEDVKIKDMDTDPTGKGAIARTHSSSYTANGEYASTICFFKDKMTLMESDLQRQHTVMHELGHALGLDENRLSTSNDRLGNIMQQGELPYGTFISLDDRASVEQAYAGF